MKRFLKWLRGKLWPLVKAGVISKLQNINSPVAYLALIRLELGEAKQVYAEQGYSALVDYICLVKVR